MLQELRQYLHQHPELSGQEKQTQQYLQDLMREQFELEGSPVAETGLVYHFPFGEGPHLLVRVDIDALPIEEENDFDHKSEKEGISHKCGHDGHTTIGVGLVKRLVEEPFSRGRVTILFQPAEETGEGALRVLSDPDFDIEEYDYALALHNIPGVPKHQILCRDQQFTAAVLSAIIYYKGKNSHAAEPRKGITPAYAIADLLSYADREQERDDAHPDFHLLTPIHAKFGGKDYGIAASRGEAHFTIRSWSQARTEEATEGLFQEAERLAKKYHLKHRVETLAEFAANRNAPELVDHIRKAAQTLGLEQVDRDAPFAWGEDFGWFTQSIPGAMFGLGAGEDTPALHNPDYDFPDEIIPTGVNMFYETLKSILQEDE